MVMSQPSRPPAKVPLKSLLRWPNVPLVSSLPSSPLIWAAKKLLRRLLGPDSRKASSRSWARAESKGVLGVAVRVEGVALDGAHSHAGVPLSFFAGVQKPETEAVAPSGGSRPRNSERRRVGRSKFS